MSVWYAIPTARPVQEANALLAKWLDQDYRIALWTDWEAPVPVCDFHHSAPAYPGYARAVNWLVKDILTRDPEAKWIVTGGDDVEPDPKFNAYTIAAQCTAHFQGTFGVMQPIGDRWGESNRGAEAVRGPYIERVCGSPWMGREFCRRMYRGRGPLWQEFQHMYVDEHLQEVAKKLGVLWQRPDLIHRHAHWGRRPDATSDHIPPHLQKWNTPAHWGEAKATFQRLQMGGFAEALDMLP